MKYHQLISEKFKVRRRRGRGIALGLGKTAGRGTKGQKSRSGHKIGFRFEGGQNPLHMRMPKMPGFKSHRPEVQIVKTSDIDKNFAPNVLINSTNLLKSGLIDDAYGSVKLIFDRQVSKAYQIEIQAVSENAKRSIEKFGGSVKIVGIDLRTKVSARKK